MVLNFLRAYIFTRRSGALVRIIGWISLVGVALSVVALVVVISVMQGFGAGIRDRLLSVEPHIVVDMPVTAVSPSDQDTFLREMSQLSGVRAHYYESQDLMLRTIDGLYSGAIGQGIESETLKSILKNLDVKSKSKLKSDMLVLDSHEMQADTYRLKRGEIVLGIDLANSLAVFEGDELVVVSPESLLLPPGEVPKYERVKVKRILRSNVPSIDSQTIFYGLDETFRNIRYGSRIERKIQLTLNDPMELDDKTAYLKAHNYKFETWQDRNSALFYSLRAEKFLMTLFLALTFLIGSFSIVTLLVLLSTQKQQDIGMMQAMGFSRARVRRLFASMGISLTFIGMSAGLVLGLIICWWIDKFSILKLPDIYYDTDLPVSVDYKTIFVVSGLVFVIAILSSWFATRQTAVLSPVEALRSSK